MLRISFVFFLVIGIQINADVWRQVNINDIDFSLLKIVKKAKDKDHERMVWVDRDTKYYYKIWTSGFWRAKHFIDALQKGFYDGITSLESLIFDDNNCCRGYVTRAGKGILSKEPLLKIDRINVRGMIIGVVAPFNVQEDFAYISFYNQLLENTKKYRFAYIDFTITNIIFIDDEYKLIDLESVLPLSQVGAQFINCDLISKDYRNLIKNICSRKLINLSEYKFSIWDYIEDVEENISYLSEAAH